ncbi:MAG TPA: hypothetical protein VJ386_07610 [Candidatus Deferrimicrobiaceae bacterium]|nr:hypothetical protein [Candidatus Deferrimicrobiaceae bacterium]
MKRKSFIGVVVLGALFVYTGITQAGGWIHSSSEGWTQKSEDVRAAKLRVENLPVYEGRMHQVVMKTDSSTSSTPAELKVENLPAFEGGEYWGPMETGTLVSSSSAKMRVENNPAFEGGKYGGD